MPYMPIFGVVSQLKERTETPNITFMSEVNGSGRDFIIDVENQSEDTVTIVWSYSGDYDDSGSDSVSAYSSLRVAEMWMPFGDAITVIATAQATGEVVSLQDSQHIQSVEEMWI
jgi:hypothetical protein